MELEERLNGIIEEKEDKIEKLESEIEELKQNLNFSRLSWMMHQSLHDDKKMPFPRLEMRFKRLSVKDWYSIEWTYGLVYKHFSETNTDNLLFIPFGNTTSNGGKGTFKGWLDQNGKLQTPFRDGAHIHAESLLFNIPMFIVCEEKGICQTIERDADISKLVAKMSSKTTN